MTALRITFDVEGEKFRIPVKPATTVQNFVGDLLVRIERVNAPLAAALSSGARQLTGISRRSDNAVLVSLPGDAQVALSQRIANGDELVAIVVGAETPVRDLQIRIASVSP
jgi:hypothetical protein